MAGKLLGAVGNFLGGEYTSSPYKYILKTTLSGFYLEGMSRWTWLAIYMPVQNISGGMLTFIMMTYSFIADNSTPRYLNMQHIFFRIRLF